VLTISRNPRTWIRLSALLTVLAGVALAPPPTLAGGDEETTAISAARVPEPAGYRLDDYRAATPATIAGGTALSTTDLQALIRTGDPVLIDVLPNPRRPDNLPAGTLWLPKPRKNIPGSVWLPEVGRGALSPELEAYFRANLARLTDGDHGRPVVFYCLATCWMSWNAAKRAISYGYQAVYWYRDGTDGWSAAGLPTERSEPLPMAGN
jgi:PQQ-dependent catabolism-associated CXXCW motif protein